MSNNKHLLTILQVFYLLVCNICLIFRKPELEATVKASIQMILNFIQHKGDTSDNSLIIMRDALSLALYSAHVHELNDKTESTTHKVQETVEILCTLLLVWVAEQFLDSFQVHHTDEMKEMQVSTTLSSHILCVHVPSLM